MDKLTFVIENKYQNISIRDFLLSFHLGKEKIYFYETSKSFFVNDEQVNQWYKLQEKDVFTIQIKENIDCSPIPSSLDVVYEDKQYLIVNKPRGLLIHDDGNNNSLTLKNMVANYYKSKHIRRNIRICNRLDIETEGLVIVAKDAISEAYVNDLIANRKVEKRYYAVCYNHFKNKEDTISLPLGKNLHKNNQMIVYKKGKEAITKYKVIKNGKKSLLDIDLITGRTHQIRVHLSYLNHSLLGDTIYGVEDNYKLGLQAYKVSFLNIFANKKISVEKSLSTELKEMLDE